MDENVVYVLKPSKAMILYPTLNPFESMLGKPIFFMYVVKFTAMLDCLTTPKDTGNKSLPFDCVSWNKSDKKVKINNFFKNPF